MFPKYIRKVLPNSFGIFTWSQQKSLNLAMQCLSFLNLSMKSRIGVITWIEHYNSTFDLI